MKGKGVLLSCAQQLISDVMPSPTTGPSVVGRISVHLEPLSSSQDVLPAAKPMDDNEQNQTEIKTIRSTKINQVLVAGWASPWLPFVSRGH